MLKPTKLSYKTPLSLFRVFLRSPAQTLHKSAAGEERLQKPYLCNFDLNFRVREMERDFMGLKESAAAVKEEIKDGSKDYGCMGTSGVQWAFSNKVSAVPPFMSFKSTPEERPKKISYDASVSPAFLPISTAEVFDSNHRISSVVNQRTFNLDRQGGHFTMPATYPVHHTDGHGVSAYRPREFSAFPASNHPFPVGMSSHPFFNIHGATTGSHIPANSVKQQPLGGIPVTTPHPMLPVMGAVASPYSPTSRNISKPTAAPAQLTIFYGGVVNVYEDVPLEKAQAIMFLAGNGSSMAASVANQRAQVLPATASPKPVVCDATFANQSHSPSPGSGLSSPGSVTSHSNAQSGCGSSNNDDLTVPKAIAGATIAPKPIGGMGPSSHPDPPMKQNSVGATTAPLIPAVPQARKASLARFLEKRKERVMNTSPYGSSKKPTESSFESDSTVFPAKSSLTITNSLPASKEKSWCVGLQKNDADHMKLLTKLEI